MQSLISAHLYYTLCCRGGGALVTAERPPDGPPGSCGPRTAARVASLPGRYRLSAREIPPLLHDFFALPLSLGSGVDLQQRCTLARAPGYSSIPTTVQQQAQITMDETGWKEAGKRRWLWALVSTVAPLLHVASRRGGKVITTLLGSAFDGIASSDRLKA